MLTIRSLAEIAHELRTPLSRIRVALDLAAQGDASNARACLAEISQDLGELETLVDDVLRTAYAETEGAGLAPRLVSACLWSLLEQARTRFATLYPTEKLEIVAPDDLPALRCDPILLRRVLDNLLDNAARHAKGTQIALRLEVATAGISFAVSDAGPGMPSTIADRAFEPCFRADRGRIGLGLSIVRSVVEAHGGAVGIDSEPGRGTTVTALIPLAQ